MRKQAVGREMGVRKGYATYFNTSVLCQSMGNMPSLTWPPPPLWHGWLVQHSHTTSCLWQTQAMGSSLQGRWQQDAGQEEPFTPLMEHTASPESPVKHCQMERDGAECAPTSGRAETFSLRWCFCAQRQPRLESSIFFASALIASRNKACEQQDARSELCWHGEETLFVVCLGTKSRDHKASVLYCSLGLLDEEACLSFLDHVLRSVQCYPTYILPMQKHHLASRFIAGNSNNTQLLILRLWDQTSSCMEWSGMEQHVGSLQGYNRQQCWTPCCCMGTCTPHSMGKRLQSAQSSPELWPWSCPRTALWKLCVSLLGQLLLAVTIARYLRGKDKSSLMINGKYQVIIPPLLP